MTACEPPRSHPRREYLARIHRVQDHIEQHLAEDLTLEELARVACFSPFHFHRIFTAVTGETLHRFILRLRVEKAAMLLRTMPLRSVTEIALDCGFSGSSQFSRSFRAELGIGATEWREASADEAKDRKICKAIRKHRQVDEGLAPYGPSIGASPEDPASAADGVESAMKNTSMKAPQKIVVEPLESMTLAYLRHVGPYAGNAELFAGLVGQLMQWAGPRGLANGPDGPQMLTIYHDDPNVTEEQKLRISMALIVPPGTRVEDPIGLMELPAGKCARATFELSVNEYGAAWNWLYGHWLPSSGYAPDDRPSYERYLTSVGAEGHNMVEIVLPVRPL